MSIILFKVHLAYLHTERERERESTMVAGTGNVLGYLANALNLGSKGYVCVG